MLHKITIHKCDPFCLSEIKMYKFTSLVHGTAAVQWQHQLSKIVLDLT